MSESLFSLMKLKNSEGSVRISICVTFNDASECKNTNQKMYFQNKRLNCTSIFKSGL